MLQTSAVFVVGRGNQQRCCLFQLGKTKLKRLFGSGRYMKGGNKHSQANGSGRTESSCGSIADGKEEMGGGSVTFYMRRAVTSKPRIEANFKTCHFKLNINK